MLVLRNFRRAQVLSRPHRSILRTAPATRRTFLTGLGNEFLDLALALPLPPGTPVYATTIILVTIATRAALLPVAIWGKQKSRVIEEVVMPIIAKEKPVVAQEVFEKMKADKIRGDKPFLIEYHAKRCQEILNARRKELMREHGCQTWKSMLVPPLVQLPPFFVITLMLRRLSEGPTPFDSEAFFTLTNLVHPDPTMTLPILLGVITMANVETNNWLMTATQRANLKKLEEKREKMKAEGKRILEPGKIIKNALRGLSVIRILVASVMPGSISLYWVTSASLGLVQTWIMDWMDYRRRSLLESKAAAAPPGAPDPASTKTVQTKRRR
ncbi:hypothetical protein CC1G_00383 [Coprinopsis cinerea okayama7|uniref:Membrane insertase YidC/Oxa/ALB C-terminal domain-containing protein n=1 Tax=Coprinopsis cinerea (strain Okayama-7 / 130 / ATCC MYA-4618 / FGSC 9003) TaxID=240176 RepID=A8NXR8_COPC7|nr:hypothetical protein CC1G_00383 [Coprinopsis cinerea okayama7\|eukprot:XP_001837247.2 hypothetical protein CC1G_00383 [Coprinopsis cinerea okayama7\